MVAYKFLSQLHVLAQIILLFTQMASWLCVCSELLNGFSHLVTSSYRRYIIVRDGRSTGRWENSYKHTYLLVLLTLFLTPFCRLIQVTCLNLFQKWEKKRKLLGKASRSTVSLQRRKDECRSTSHHTHTQHCNTTIHNEIITFVIAIFP